MTATAEPAEPSTLPQGIRSLTLTYTLFIVLDLTLFWQLAGHAIAARVNALMPLNAHHAFLSNDAVMGAMLLVSLMTTLSFLWFPLLFLNGRAPIAVAAFRKLCAALIVLHLILVTIIANKLLSSGFHPRALAAVSTLSLPLGFIAIPATPLLYYLAKPLVTLRWLKLDTPVKDWEKLVGIDGSGRPTIAALGGKPSTMELSLLVPPLACFRARWVVRGVIASLLWLLGLALLLIEPFRAVIAFAAAASLGRQVGIASLRKPDITPPISDAQRLATLHRIFTPDRLRKPPPELAPGIIAYFFILPGLALLTTLVLTGNAAPSAEILRQIVPASIILTPLATIPIAGPSAVLLPLGVTFGAWWYKITGALVIVQYLLLLGFSWHVTIWPFGTSSPTLTPLLALLRESLLIIAPFILAIALSLPRSGTLPNLIKSPITINADGSDGR